MVSKRMNDNPAIGNSTWLSVKKPVFKLILILILFVAISVLGAFGVVSTPAIITQAAGRAFSRPGLRTVLVGLPLLILGGLGIAITLRQLLHPEVLQLRAEGVLIKPSARLAGGERLIPWAAIRSARVERVTGYRRTQTTMLIIEQGFELDVRLDGGGWNISPGDVAERINRAAKTRPPEQEVRW